MTRRPVARNMITTMIGALAMPLTTALQNSALIGSTCVTFSRTPANVEIAMIAQNQGARRDFFSKPTGHRWASPSSFVLRPLHRPTRRTGKG